MAARPQRPSTRRDFEVAIICALTLEADAVEALFDHHWDEGGPRYDKALGDLNAYSTGAVGRHNVVLAHMPGMGKASAAAVAANCRVSFPNIKLAVVVGVCGALPFGPGGEEVVLGDVIVSDGIVQYDFGLRLSDRFVRKDTLLDSLGRPNAEIRALLAKLKGLRSRKMLQGKMAGYISVLQSEPELGAEYPGITQDRLFEATYHHVSDGMSCEECGCNGKLVPRSRLEQGNPQPAIHFGLIASGDTVMKSGEERDAIAWQEGVIGFEMEGAGVWDSFPCVVIKGACDYADSHKTEAWQRYASATAAACMKAFLDYWVPSPPEPVPVPEKPSGPWFLVPYPKNETFVGRRATLEKLKQLPLRSASQTRVSLFGLGGIGKTQIALEYAYWLQEICPDVSVFWVHASNAQRFRQAFTSIAQECHIPGHNDPKVDVLPLVKTWLERKDQGRWLMVIDNADDVQLFFGQPEGFESSHIPSPEVNLGRYIPECAHGSILVTTRNKLAGSRLAKGTPPIEVRKMDDNESDQLLRAKFGEGDLASSELSTLSDRLEHLPLALVQAAAFIQENTIAVGEYLQLLDTSDQHLVDLLSEEFETVGRDSETPRAVTETWILSFEQIQRQNAFAGELLSLMSLFDRQAIPSEFLFDYGKKQQVQGPKEEIQLSKALGVLKAFSFVAEERGQGLDMHRLVQLVTQKWLVKKGTIKHFAGQALLAVSHSYPFGNFKNRAICGAYLAHVYAVLKLEGTQSKDESVAKATLLHCTAGFFDLQGQWKDAEKFQVQAIELRRAVLGKEHPDTLASMANLASTYWNQGRWKEAELLGIQAMETTKRVLGEEHPDTLSNMHNLASVYWNQGRWKEAELLGVRVVETRKRVLAEEHPDTLSSIVNLASVYCNQGRWKEAEFLGVQVMETTKRVLGEEHPDTLSNMANLASTYWNQGRWKEAELLGVQVMETRKRVLGEEHPDTLTGMNNLASTYQNQGRWKEAELLEVQVMETTKRVLGEEHPNTLSSMNNVASTYRNQGRWKEAELLGAQVMEIRKRVLREEHPDTLSSMANLASIYQTQGRWKEAELLGVQVVETTKRVLGEEHPDTLTGMNNLASVYSNEGRWKEAELLEVQVIEMRKRVLGEEHPNTLASIANLASTYWNQGRWKEAELLGVEVMETRKRVLGEEHPDTLTSMNNLAFNWKSQGRLTDALALMRNCFHLRRRILGPDHPYTINTLSTLNKWQEASDNLHNTSAVEIAGTSGRQQGDDS